MSYGDEPLSMTAQATADLIRSGFHVFGNGVDQAGAKHLLSAVKAARTFDAGLFLTEAEFDADPQYTGVNPRPGRNLLENFDPLLDFVEQDAGIVRGLTELL